VSFYLGVDGGGSKTEFLLIDESGRVLASHRAGSAYYLETGLEALEAMLAGGIRETLQKAEVPAGKLAFAFIGLPAYGEDSALLPRLDRIAASALPVERYRCGNDMVCGWAGALAGQEGINLVAGTGSIAYGEYGGRCARVGGWGELFSDEGSAYWIAREALRLFSRMSDGRAPKGPLYAMIRERFALRGDLDLCGAIYGPPPLARSELASLAPILGRAAQAGDTQAQGVFESAALELASMVHAVRESLDPPASAALRVSYSGGMSHFGELLLAPLRAALRAGDRRYEFVPPQMGPGAGAALYAAVLSGTPLAAAALAALARQCAAQSAEALLA
jgi:N-acetylglucosamine kinase-like BadF-type ATPase